MMAEEMASCGGSVSEVRAFVGLGANLGVGRDNLLAAWQRLGREPGIVTGRLSRPWRSEPVGVSSRRWFTNAVGEIFTALSAPELLAALLAIESELGRDRASQGEDRPIDLDLLFYGDAVVELPTCRVPHPELARRRFVLEPLRELTPELRHPVAGRTIAQLAAALAAAPEGRTQGIEPGVW